MHLFLLLSIVGLIHMLHDNGSSNCLNLLVVWNFSACSVRVLLEFVEVMLMY